MESVTQPEEFPPSGPDQPYTQQHLGIPKPEVVHDVVPPQRPSPARFGELFRRHQHETVTYCMVFWGFGMCVALLGPTLLDLGCRTSNRFSAMSWAFFSQSLCTLLGSATGGILVQRYGTHPVMLVSCSMLAFTLAVLAWCEKLMLLALVLAVMGYFMGSIDTVANLAMLSLYGTSVAPFMQALHFFYGLGALVSPLISLPFLLGDGCASGVIPSPASPSASPGPPRAQSRIQYAFWIMALLQVPVILMVLSLILKQVARDKEPDLDNLEMKDSNLKTYPPEVLRSPGPEVLERPHTTPAQVALVTGLSSLLLFLSDGMQASYGGYVYSYAVKSMADLGVVKAAYLNACFWGTFAFGRLISIWFATRLAPGFMLVCNISGCVAAMVIMTLQPHSPTALYLGTALFGASLSSVYPTTISLADTYILLTSPITTVMVVSAAAGETSLPVIVGHEFEHLGPGSFLGTGLAASLVSALVLAALHLTGASILRHSAQPGVLGALSSCLPRAGRSGPAEDSGLMRHHVRSYSRMRSDLSETSLGDGDYGGNNTHEPQRAAS